MYIKLKFCVLTYFLIVLRLFIFIKWIKCLFRLLTKLCGLHIIELEVSCFVPVKSRIIINRIEESWQTGK